MLHGDWTVALDLGPFDLIFVDSVNAKASGADLIIDALPEVGLVVLDDLTPLDQWPEEWRGKPDPIRDIWLYRPMLDIKDIRIANDHAVIQGRKRRPA